MELKDAKQILSISNEERKQVQDYLGFKQARVDLLLDLEPYTVASKEKDDFEMFSSVDELFEDVNVLADVYGVMLKSESELESDVFYKEADVEVCKFFSGVTRKSNRVIKKENPDYEDNINLDSGRKILIRYKTQGIIPHIKSSDYVQNVDTDEYVFAPFLQVEKFEYEKNIDGIECYESILKNRLFIANDIESKKNDLEAYIRENFEGFKEFVSYAKKTGKVVFDNSYIKANKFKNAVREYVEISCMEKAKDIMIARDIVSHEQERYETELAERLDAGKKRSMIRGMQMRLSTSPNKAQSFFDRLDKLEELIQTENEYVYYAKRLKIPYSRRLDVQSTKNRIKLIKEAVREMVQNVSTVTVFDEMQEDEIRKTVAPVQDDLRIIESLQLDIEGIEYLPHIFKSQMDLAFKEQIDRRAFDVIRNLRLIKYRNELSQIPEKPSFWHRITGRAKVMQLQRENLKSKIELESLRQYEKKRTYSARDVLIDIDKETKLLGITTPEVVDFRSAVSAVFEVDEDDIKKEVDEKVAFSRNLPTVFDPKKATKKVEIEFLQNVNKFLLSKIEIMRDEVQDKLRAQSTKKTSDVVNERGNFISDIEIYNTVNTMLFGIEEKTVQRILDRKKSKEKSNQDMHSIDDDKYAQSTNEEYIV